MLARARVFCFASVYFDPMDVMRDAATASTFERMLNAAQEWGWQLAPLCEIEQRWRPVLELEFG